ncbi:MAG TPA: hypothetical protein VF607_08400 [Verrucomicrobiae bacterium]
MITSAKVKAARDKRTERPLPGFPDGQFFACTSIISDEYLMTALRLGNNAMEMKPFAVPKNQNPVFPVKF